MYSPPFAVGTTSSNLFTPAQQSALQQALGSRRARAQPSTRVPRSGRTQTHTPPGLPSAFSPAVGTSAGRPLGQGAVESPFSMRAATPPSVASSGTRSLAPEEIEAGLLALPPELTYGILQILYTQTPRDALRACAVDTRTRAFCQVEVIPWRQQFPALAAFMDPNVGDRASVQQIAHASIRREQHMYECILNVVRRLGTSIDPDLGDNVAEWAQRPASNDPLIQVFQSAAADGALTLYDVTNPQVVPLKARDVSGLVFLTIQGHALAQDRAFHDARSLRDWANSVLHGGLFQADEEAYNRGTSPCMAYDAGSGNLVGLLLDAIPGSHLYAFEVGSGPFVVASGLALGMPAMHPPLPALVDA